MQLDVGLVVAAAIEARPVMTASSKYKPTVGLLDEEMPRTIIWLSPTPRLLTWMDGSKRVKLSNENAAFSRIASPLTAATASGGVLHRRFALGRGNDDFFDDRLLRVRDSDHGGRRQRDGLADPDGDPATEPISADSHASSSKLGNAAASRIPTTHNFLALQLAYHHPNRRYDGIFV